MVSSAAVSSVNHTLTVRALIPESGGSSVGECLGTAVRFALSHLAARHFESATMPFGASRLMAAFVGK